MLYRKTIWFFWRANKSPVSVQSFDCTLYIVQWTSMLSIFQIEFYEFFGQNVWIWMWMWMLECLCVRICYSFILFWFPSNFILLDFVECTFGWVSFGFDNWSIMFSLFSSTHFQSLWSPPCVSKSEHPYKCIESNHEYECVGL